MGRALTLARVRGTEGEGRAERVVGAPRRSDVVAAHGSRELRVFGAPRSRAGLAAHRSRVVAVRAGAQHGQISREQLVELGIDNDARRRLVDGGRLVVRHEGVFAVAGFAPGFHADAMASVLAGGEEALLSHLAGAALFTGSAPPPGPLSVTVPRGCRRPRASVDFRETASMPRPDRHFGIPVTRPEQVALDCATLLGRDGLDRLVDELVAGRRVTMGQLDAHVAASAGRPGVVGLRETLDAAGVGMTRSEAELRLRRTLTDAGLGPFALNARVLGRERDAWFPRHRVVVEVQTMRFHGTPARLDADTTRALELQAHDIEPVAVTARMLRDRPLAFVAGLAPVLARRAA